MSKLFAVSNNKIDRKIIYNVEKEFCIKNPNVLDIINKKNSKKLLPMAPKPLETFFDDSCEPILSEYCQDLKDNFNNFKEGAPLSHRKGLSALSSGINNVTVKKININKKQFPLVACTTKPIKPRNYDISVRAVASLFGGVAPSYTCYTLMTYFNKYLNKFIHYTAEIDALLSNGKPVEIKSHYKPEYLNFSVRRSDILYNYNKKRKIYVAVQCKRANVEDIILLFHDEKYIRVEHFYLNEFMRGVEKEVEEFIDLVDKNFAKLFYDFSIYKL